MSTFENTDSSDETITSNNNAGFKLPTEKTPEQIQADDCHNQNDSEDTDKDTESSGQQRQKLADALVELALAQNCQLFHNGSGQTFATVAINSHKETWLLKSQGFSRWLKQVRYLDTGLGISSQVVTEAISTLDARAIYDGEEFQTHIRAAHHNGSIYMDLCNERWQALEITASGWSIMDNPPVKFIRTAGMLPLPLPVAGGNPVDKIGRLRSLINARSDNSWKLIIAWLLAAYSTGPYPVLAIFGEQGSAKSFTCRLLRRLIDPSEVEVTASPKERRDVILAANNSYVVALDNLSGIPCWLSDSLCGISTGTASRERQLFTNGEEVLFKAKRPIVLNGIDLAMKGDLADRSLILSLDTIPEDERRDEKDVLAEFDDAMPEILGGICDVLVQVLKNFPTIKLPIKPRMADFALWITAAEEPLGWQPNEFLHAYNSNRNEAIELTLQSDSLGTALWEYLQINSELIVHWKDLAGKLLGDEDGRKLPRDWPPNAKAMAARLKRLAPALRAVGIHYKHERDGNKRYYHFWTKEQKSDSPVRIALIEDDSPNADAVADIFDGKVL